MKERKFEWYSMKESFYAFFNPYYHIIDKDINSTWSGWEERRIENHSRYNCCIVSIRATYVDYDRKVVQTNDFRPWLGYKFVKYEVKPNPYGIQAIEYRKGEGWFIIGDNINLYRKRPDEF